MTEQLTLSLQTSLVEVGWEKYSYFLMMIQSTVLVIWIKAFVKSQFDSFAHFPLLFPCLTVFFSAIHILGKC